MDPIQGLDWGAYYWFRTQRNLGIAAVDWLLTALANMASIPFLTILAVLVALGLWRRKNRRGAAVFLASTVVAVGILVVLQIVVHRPTTADAEPGFAFSSFVFGSFPSTGAFLSSMVLSVLAMVVASDCRRFRSRVAVYLIFAALILAIGAGQLYLGLHMLTDVWAGWAGGTLLALAGDRIAGYSRPNSRFSSGIEALNTAK